MISNGCRLAERNRTEPSTLEKNMVDTVINAMPWRFSERRFVEIFRRDVDWVMAWFLSAPGP